MKGRGKAYKSLDSFVRITFFINSQGSKRNLGRTSLACNKIAGNLGGYGLALLDVGPEPIGLVGSDEAELDHQVLEQNRIDLAAKLDLVDGVFELIVGAETLLDGNFAEYRIVACLWCRHFFLSG